MKKINLMLLAGFFSLNLLAQHNYDNQSVIYSDNGNVGIGTSSPLSLLYLQQTTNDYTGGLRIVNSANGRQFNLFVDGSNNSRINSSSNGSGALILNSGGGNVGIGTASPAANLHVNGTSQFDGTGYFSGSLGIGTATPRGTLDVDGSGNIYLVDDPNNNGSQSIYLPGHMFIAPYNGGDIAYVQARRQNSTGSTSMRFRTYDAGQLTEAMHIDSEGNIGVGTVTPSSLLHLHQTTNDISGGVKIVNSGQTRQFNLFVDGSNDSRIDSGSDGSGELVLNSGGGNVGIGTTSPDANLAVNGDIHAQEVRVDMLGWPDYVFEEDYTLRSLDVVEKYIKENKHLPGIPSEAEVKENGVNLGDMNAKLLQKIEELTLYLIEQNKQLGKQNQQIEALKARIVKSEKQ